jgi:hypothetical protein
VTITGAPPRYGCNLQWAFVGRGALVPPPDERLLDFLATYGFDFVRLPMDYRVWTDGTDYRAPTESVLAALDAYVSACRDRAIHLAINLHRAPGYCITGQELEAHDLWHDAPAQAGFVAIWQGLAGHFRDVPSRALSFDLVNEPPAIGSRGFSREAHESLIRRTVSAIRAVDRDRPLVIDGLDGGNLAMPELADLAALGVAQSTRGYAPYPVTHWGADWWFGWRDGDAPRWPGVVYEGHPWDVGSIREFYEPWRRVEAMGVPIHVGEFGCYDQTPNADALRWFGDALGLFREFGWGYALWEFEGPFGIVGHRRAGARFEPRHGYLVDVDLLGLLLAGRVQA